MKLLKIIKSWFSKPEPLELLDPAKLPDDYIKNNFTTIRTDDGFNVHCRKYPLFNSKPYWASTAEGMDVPNFKWQEFDEKGHYDSRLEGCNRFTLSVDTCDKNSLSYFLGYNSGGDFHILLSAVLKDEKQFNEDVEAIERIFNVKKVQGI